MCGGFSIFDGTLYFLKVSRFLWPLAVLLNIFAEYPMKKFLLLLALCMPVLVSAQVQKITFDGPFDAKTYGKYRLVADGVKGRRVLDLTSAASWRMPVTLDSAVRPCREGSYSIAVWVKTPKGQLQGGSGCVIATSADKTLKSGGFTIGAAANGSWYAGMTDAGNNTLWYEPTQVRQPIDDGRWHLLALTYDKEQGKARFYYDGRNVAIYNVAELGTLSSTAPIRVGGADSTEWNAFNGFIDEFAVYDAVLEPDAVFGLYAAFDRKARLLELPERTDDLRLMGFNIWHGGNETGGEAGPQRVVDIIRDSGAEVVGLIETYGSGAKIADELGYCLYLHSSNLSILSRYPIVGTADFFRPFNCMAAKIQVSRTQTVNYINLWLHYLPDTRQQLTDGVGVDSIVRGEWTTRAAELRQILKEAGDAGFIGGEVPTFVSGDFNIDSHLDWVESTREEHGGYVVPWPTSMLMEEAGFTDSYRKLYPDPKTDPCKTWSPAYLPQEDGFYYRIDFIFYKGPGVKPKESRMIDSHAVRFPSDHAAMLTVFGL